jgi:hypothetical protein
MASESMRPETPATPLDAAAVTLVVDGRERPAHDNRGQPLHWSVEGARNFWRWFEDSKAVDEKGRPLVAYHTTDCVFTEFRKGEKDGLSGKGIYFSDYPLNQYGSKVISVYLKILSPITRQTELPGMRELNSAGIPTKIISDVFDKFPAFDGVMNRMEITVNSPSQIKSATDNSGLFDPTSNHLFDPIDRPELSTSMPLRSEKMNGYATNVAQRDITDNERLDDQSGASPKIFVFGSNLAGRHGKRAALAARNEHGAVYGVGVGRTGNSYAIPTKDEDIQTLPLERIKGYVDDFLNYAKANPSLEFEVTRIGCGLAGYSDAEISPMFSSAPDNCHLPDGWASSADARTENDTQREVGRSNDSIVLVEPSQMLSFQKRLDSLNKKAVAFGLEPIKIIDTKDVVYERNFNYTGKDGDTQESYLVPLRDGQHTDHPVLLKRIEIAYPEVKLGNWRVVGKIEAVDGGNLAFSVSQNASDVAALNSRADHPIECEHCNTKRKRNDGYLLRDEESGDYKQVGGNCLEDFTGHDPATALFLARMYDVVRIAEGELQEYGRSGQVNAVGTRNYLADVSFITDRSGFVSAAKARDTDLLPTYDVAFGLPLELQGNRKLLDEWLDEREKHLAKADTIRDWVAAGTGESSFDRNVKLLLQADAISRDRKHLAFAAAAVPMYNRSLAVAAEARKPSEHIGSPGEKMTATLTIHRIVPMESQFGVTHLVLMHDKDGNNVKWKASACPYEMRTEGVGRTMEASFKIKEHDNYKDKAQTAVTHLKVVRWLDPENTAGKLDDDPAAHGPEMSTYGASIFMHPADAPRGYSNIVMASNGLTGDALVAEAKSWAINQLRSEGENQWLTSGPDDYGNTYSLHLHTVDDKEPTPSDFKHVEDMLGASPARRFGAEDHKTPLYESHP